MISRPHPNGYEPAVRVVLERETFRPADDLRGLAASAPHSSVTHVLWRVAGDQGVAMCGVKLRLASWSAANPSCRRCLARTEL